MIHLLPPLAFLTCLELALALGAGSAPVREALALLPTSGWIDHGLRACGWATALGLTLRRVDLSMLSATRVARFVLALVIAVVAYSALLELRELHNVLNRVTDFGILYASGQAVTTGLDPYVDSLPGYYYPPTFAGAFGILTFLPLAWASVLWFALKLWLLSKASAWTSQVLPMGNLDAARQAWVFLAVLAGSGRFWLHDLQYGNTNVVVLAAVAGCLFLDRAGRPRPAALLLAIAASIKVVPLILILWLVARRRWNTLLWTGAALAGLAFVTTTFTSAGPAALWSSYWQHGVVSKLGEDLSQPDNQSMLGMLSRLEIPALRATWMATSLALAGLFFWATHRARGRKLAEIAAAAMGPACILAISPGSWVVHYALVMLPLSAVLAFAWITGPRRTLLGVFWLGNVAFTMSGWSRATVGWSIHQSWFLWALLMLLGALAWLSLRAE